MPSLPAEDQSLDQDLDPMERADREELAQGEDGEGDAAPVISEDAVVVAEIPPELEEEIVQILATEEPNPKKAQMISQDLINRELSPEDLMDEGSI